MDSINKPLIITVVSLLSMTLSACVSPTPSTSAIETAIAQTQTSIPTLTPIPSQTPISLSEIDLESILLINGDLPTIFEGGQVKSEIPKKFRGIPEADQLIQQAFKAGALGSDPGIMILLYSSVSDLNSAYDIVSEITERNGPGLQLISDVGEKAVASAETLDPLPLIGGSNIPGGTSVQVVFSRCHAIVYIDLFSPEANMDVATTYGQRLDKRLKSIVCP